MNGYRTEKRVATLLLGGVSLLALTVGPALAQTSDQTAVETVIVTAQHRAQNILDVPYNISAVSGYTIDQDHVLDTAELMRSIPGVTVVDRGDRNADVVSGIRIRGLNVDSSALGDYEVSAAATVSTYVNDTPIFANFLLSPTEIDRVEVLKGPQGTLYGSGSLGGTVRYIMRAPQLGEFSAELTGSGSNVDDSSGIGWSGTATVNVPVGDTIALRLTLTRNDFPGVTDYVNLYQLDATGTPVAPKGIADPTAAYYDKKDADFAKQWYGRAALLWKPTSNFDMTLTYMDQSDQFGGRRATTLGVNGYGVPYKDNQEGSVILEPSNRDVYLASLEANLDLGFATLTSSTSAYDNRGSIVSDNTGFYAQNGWLMNFYYNYPRPLAEAYRHYADKAFIEEVRLVSSGTSRFDYVIGAYYQNQETYSAQDSYLKGFQQWWNDAICGYFGPCEAAVVDNQDYLYRNHEHFTDAAFYGDLTWHVTDTFQLTGGIRWFDDTERTHVYQQTGLYAFIRDTSDSTGRQETNKPIFKANASWKFDPDAMLYATVAEGYRHGGSNGVPTTGNFAESPVWVNYKPDNDIDYEVGVKGTWRGITYTADLFYVNWWDIQLNSATTNWGFFAVLNGKDANTKGAELQIAGNVLDHLHYGLGYTYTEADLGADLYTPDRIFLINTKGGQLPGAPKNIVDGSLDYDVPLPSATLLFHLDGYYQSSTQDTASSNGSSLNTYPFSPYFGLPKFYSHMDGFSLWNTSVSYNRDSWSATLWAKNIFDARAVTGVYTQAYMGTAPAENFDGNASKALNALPRTIGVTLDYKF